MKLAIDKSLFTGSVAHHRYRCSGCGSAIVKGDKIFTKPFYYRHTQTGLIRLHNLGECWDEWADRVAEQVALAREMGERKSRTG